MEEVPSKTLLTPLMPNAIDYATYYHGYSNCEKVALENIMARKHVD